MVQDTVKNDFYSYILSTDKSLKKINGRRFNRLGIMKSKK